MTGDVGVECEYKGPTKKTTIKGNQFGTRARFMTGSMGGEPAKTFNENFWN